MKIKEIAKEKKETYKLSDEERIQELSTKIEALRAQSIEDSRIDLLKENIRSAENKINNLNTSKANSQKLLNVSITKRNQYPEDDPEYVKYQRQVTSHQTAISRDNKEIIGLQSQINAWHQDMLKIMDENGLGKNKEINVLAAERDSIRSRINNDNYDELIDREYGGFQAKMLAFSELKDEKPITRISALFITLLFIIIEVSPTFFKMMMAAGPYDCLLDVERHSKKVASMQMISDMNDRINTELQITTGKNKNRLEIELANNKLLLEQIASVQSEILSKAIAQWREEELMKVEENPTQYIKGGVAESK